MINHPIGVQLYSIREACAQDLPGSLERVAKMGYTGVEFAGYHGYDAAAVRTLLDDNGLQVAGSHVPIDDLLGDKLEQTAEFNLTIGNKYLVCPWLGGYTDGTKASWLKAADVMNEVADRLKPFNLLTGYHNHGIEFANIDSEIPWDIFFGAPKQEVIMQVDFGNALSGGADAVPYLSKYPGRAVTVHLKDYSATDPDAVIGEGEVDWQKVFSLCETVGGTQWYIVEQEQENLPPFETIERGLHTVRGIAGL